MLKNTLSKGFFFSSGFISLLTQIVLLRELVTWLGGDEMFYALGLGCWLISVGLGSFYLGRKIKKINLSLIFILLVVFACSAPLVLIMLRYGLSLSLAPGQISSLGQSIMILFLMMFLPAFLSGLLFYLGCRQWGDSTQGYIYETLGFFTAGLVFTFFLSRSGFPLPKKLNKWTLGFRYPEVKNVVYSQGSQLVVTKNSNQTSVFAGGHLIFSDQQTEFDEVAGQILSTVKSRQDKVLSFGNLHLTNQISQKFAGEEIFFLQPDKEMFKLQQEYINENVLGETKTLNKFLKEKRDLDWIILSPGPPNTLSTARYYSLENLELIKKNLSNQGIGVLIFDLPVAYQSKEATRFGQVVYQTFDRVFNQTDLLVIEGRIVLLGSAEKIVFDAEHNKQLLNLILEDSKREQLKEGLSRGSQITTKLRPLAYFYHHLFWQTIFSFRLPKLLQQFSWVFPISLMLAFGFLFIKKSNRIEVLVVLSSFILMCLQTALLFLFQTQFGLLYSYLGLIMGMVLLGMAIGVGLSKKIAINPRLGLFMYLPLGLALVNGFWQEIIIIWILVGLLIGLVCGLIFGLVNRQWANKSGQNTYIYVMDLIGAFLGSVLSAVILFPWLGFELVMALICFLTLLPNTRNFLRARRG